MKYSITKRLFISVLALLLPLLFLQGCVYVRSRSMVTEEIRSSAVSNLEYLQSMLERKVQDVADASNTVLSQAKIGLFYALLAHDQFESPSAYYSQLSDIRSALRILKYSNDLIGDVTLIFPLDGIALDASGMTQIDYAFLDRLYAAAETAPAHLLGVEEQLYSVSALARTESLENAHVLLCVKLQKETLIGALNSYSENQTRFSYLLSAESDFLLGSRDADEVTAGALRPLLESARDGNVIKHSLYIRDKSYEGFLCYSRRLQAGIIQLIPSAYYNQVPSMIGLLLFLLCGATLIVLFSLLHVVRRAVGRPVSGLQSAFREAGNGNFSARLPEQQVLEFDQLAKGFNTMAENLNRLIDTNYRQTIRLQSAEFKRLQAQINPHFLYNSFYFLRHLISSEEHESAEELCHYLGLYFQYITRGDRNTIALEDEISHAVNYLTIQLMRFGDTVEADIQPLPDAVKTLTVPRLIVEPVVENCFKHGLNTTEAAGRIRIRYEADQAMLSIFIENNGNDLTEEALSSLRRSLEMPADEATSFTGLINTHHRLKLFFGPEAGVEISRSELGGLMVRLKLMLQKNGQAGEEAS